MFVLISNEKGKQRHTSLMRASSRKGKVEKIAVNCVYDMFSASLNTVGNILTKYLYIIGSKQIPAV